MTSTKVQKTLEEIRNNSSLEYLHLSNNQIGDPGAVKLAEALRNNSSLRYLNLSNNQIGDPGVMYLTEAFKTHSPSLRLNLQHNWIDGSGAQVTKAFKQNIHPETKDTPEQRAIQFLCEGNLDKLRQILYSEEFLVDAPLEYPLEEFKFSLGSSYEHAKRKSSRKFGQIQHAFSDASYTQNVAERGNNMLHLATFHRQHEIVQFLIEEWDADPDCLNVKGQTCFDIAHTQAQMHTDTADDYRSLERYFEQLITEGENRSIQTETESRIFRNVSVVSQLEGLLKLEENCVPIANIILPLHLFRSFRFPWQETIFKLRAQNIVLSTKSSLEIPHFSPLERLAKDHHRLGYIVNMRSTVHHSAMPTTANLDDWSQLMNVNKNDLEFLLVPSSDIFYVFEWKSKHIILGTKMQRRRISRLEWTIEILRLCSKLNISKIDLPEPSSYFSHGVKKKLNPSDRAKVQDQRFAHASFPHLTFDTERRKLWVLVQRMLAEQFPQYSLPQNYWDLHKWLESARYSMRNDFNHLEDIQLLARMLDTLENVTTNCAQLFKHLWNQLSEESRRRYTLVINPKVDQFCKYKFLVEGLSKLDKSCLFLVRDVHNAHALRGSFRKGRPNSFRSKVLVFGEFMLLRDLENNLCITTFQTVSVLPNLLEKYEQTICCDDIREYESALPIVADSPQPVALFSYDYENFLARQHVSITLSDHTTNTISLIDACIHLWQLQKSNFLPTVTMDQVILSLWESIPLTHRRREIADILDEHFREQVNDRDLVEEYWSSLFVVCRKKSSVRFIVESNSVIHLITPDGSKIMVQCGSGTNAYDHVLREILVRDFILFTSPLSSFFQHVTRQSIRATCASQHSEQFLREIKLDVSLCTFLAPQEFSVTISEEAQSNIILLAMHSQIFGWQDASPLYDDRIVRTTIMCSDNASDSALPRWKEWMKHFHTICIAIQSVCNISLDAHHYLNVYWRGNEEEEILFVGIVLHGLPTPPIDESKPIEFIFPVDHS